MRRQAYSIATEVAAVTALTPRMTRIRLAGDGLRGLHAIPGQTVQLLVPVPGSDTTARRDYTVRHHDAEAGAMDVDFVLHGDGPAATWARQAAPGQVIEFLGPSGRPWNDSSADWHLFAGDETAVPAILAMAEALPGDARAWLFLEVADTAEHQPVDSPAHAYWLHRKDAEPGTSTVLEDALAQAALPPGRGRMWLAGHTPTVRRIRADLLDRRRVDRRRVDRRDLYVRGFWGPRTARDRAGAVGAVGPGR